MKKVIALILTMFIVVFSFIAYNLFIDINNKKISLAHEADKLPNVNPKETYINNLIDNMTIEEKVGQMFIVRYDNSLDSLDYHVGGIILFGNDFTNKDSEEVKEMIYELQSNCNIPLIIGTDEEGGIVNRVSLNENLRYEPFKSSQELYSEGGLDLIIEDTIKKCNLLKSLGINMNFAPVADVSEDLNDYIYYRTLGQNANITSEYIKAVVSTMKDNKVISCLKHFPGYGNNVDTHSSIGHDYRSLESFYQNDFLPFIAGIKENVPFILVSHNIIEEIDNEYPASLSYKVHEILRNDLNFDGLIITDDLVMRGITDMYGAEESAILAIEAGNDIVLSTDYKRQINAVIEALNSKRISEERLNASLYRILELKIDYGLIDLDTILKEAS